ncbi:MAG: hypothetical protein AVDCRST_MAG73-2963, partial [uncultured Thermomicrobiales bacterium]
GSGRRGRGSNPGGATGARSPGDGLRPPGVWHRAPRPGLRRRLPRTGGDSRRRAGGRPAPSAAPARGGAGSGGAGGGGRDRREPGRLPDRPAPGDDRDLPPLGRGDAVLPGRSQGLFRRRPRNDARRRLRRGDRGVGRASARRRHHGRADGALEGALRRRSGDGADAARHHRRRVATPDRRFRGPPRGRIGRLRARLRPAVGRLQLVPGQWPVAGRAEYRPSDPRQRLDGPGLPRVLSRPPHRTRHERAPVVSGSRLRRTRDPGDQHPRVRDRGRDRHARRVGDFLGRGTVSVADRNAVPPRRDHRRPRTGIVHRRRQEGTRRRKPERGAAPAPRRRAGSRGTRLPRTVRVKDRSGGPARPPLPRRPAVARLPRHLPGGSRPAWPLVGRRRSGDAPGTVQDAADGTSHAVVDRERDGGPRRL